MPGPAQNRRRTPDQIAEQIKKNALQPHRPLSAMQTLLIDAYFECSLVKRTALTNVGLSPKSVKIFERPAVVAEIERRLAEKKVQHEVTYDRLIEELAKVAFFNISEVMKFDEATGKFTGFNLDREQIDILAAIGEIQIADTKFGTRVTVKPYNKLNAVEQLIRHAGLSRETIHVQHEVNLTDRLRAGRERSRQRALANPPAPIIDAEFTEIDPNDRA